MMLAIMIHYFHDSQYLINFFKNMIYEYNFEKQSICGIKNDIISLINYLYVWVWRKIL